MTGVFLSQFFIFQFYTFVLQNFVYETLAVLLQFHTFAIQVQTVELKTIPFCINFFDDLASEVNTSDMYSLYFEGHVIIHLSDSVFVSFLLK